MEDFRTLLRVVKEPQYFIEKHFHIVSHKEGDIIPKLNQEQQRVLSVYQPSYLDSKFVSYGMNRQSGKSTLIAGLTLHQSLFNDNQGILVLSPNPRMSESLRNVLHYGWEHLPEILKLKIVRDTKTLIEFANGSVIHFRDIDRAGCYLRGSSFNTIFIQDRELYKKENWIEFVYYVVPVFCSTTKVLDLYSNSDLIATNNLEDLKTWS